MRWADTLPVGAAITGGARRVGDGQRVDRIGERQRVAAGSAIQIIGVAIAGSFAAVQPDPSWSFLNSVGRPDILLYVMLLILFVNTTATGRECLRRDRKAHLTIIPIKILLIYSLARFYIGLAWPLDQTDPTRTIVGLSLALLFGGLAAIGRQREF